MLASTKGTLVPRVSSGRGSPALPKCLDDPACCSLCLQALLGNPSGGKKERFGLCFYSNPETNRPRYSYTWAASGDVLDFVMNLTLHLETL